jgi:UDP-glucose 4-epimerase
VETVLITGGAGYIGYNTVRLFQKNNLKVVSIDNMSRGNIWAKENVTFIEGDINENSLIKDVIKKYQIKTIIHFAAFAYVFESIKSPSKYFDNNVIKSLNFIETAVDAGAKNFIFSSSCAVYGNPITIPITEKHQTIPINPYGETKLFIEKVLHWYGLKFNLNYVILRYFNAAGASLLFKSGEYHQPETHLIPLLIKSVLYKDTIFKVFGNDYDTLDGTAVRDFIHIDDLSNAHYLAYNYLKEGNSNIVVNLGTGKGYSILEIIKLLEEITNKQIKYENNARRDGDPPILIANYDTAEKYIGWIPKIGIKEILKSAYLWETKTLPNLLK